MRQLRRKYGKAIGVERLTRHKGRAPQVEPRPRGEVLDIGQKTQKAREAQQEDQVEIGKRARTGIEPGHGMGHVVEQAAALRLAAQGIIEKLCEEQRDGRLVGVVGQGNERQGYGRILRSLQTGLGAVVPFYVEHGQGLEQGVAHGRTPRTAHPDGHSHAAHLCREEVDYERFVVVLDAAEHDGL